MPSQTWVQSGLARSNFVSHRGRGLAHGKIGHILLVHLLWAQGECAHYIGLAAVLYIGLMIKRTGIISEYGDCLKQWSLKTWQWRLPPHLTIFCSNLKNFQLKSTTFIGPWVPASLILHSLEMWSAGFTFSRSKLTSWKQHVLKIPICLMKHQSSCSQTYPNRLYQCKRPLNQLQMICKLSRSNIDGDSHFNFLHPIMANLQFSAPREILTLSWWLLNFLKLLFQIGHLELLPLVYHCSLDGRRMPKRNTLAPILLNLMQDETPRQPT